MCRLLQGKKLVVFVEAIAAFELAEPSNGDYSVGDDLKWRIIVQLWTRDRSDRRVVGDKQMYHVAETEQEARIKHGEMIEAVEMVSDGA